MRYLEAITHSDPHAEALANMQPQQLADGWDRIAFLEAIKCAPQRPRSEPYPEMFEACPPTYLADELEILRPKTVLGSAGHGFETLFDRCLETAATSSGARTHPVWKPIRQ